MTMRATPLMLLLGLSACMPIMDMQGVDPREYYAAHPIKNKVEMKSQSHMVAFAPGEDKLSRLEAARFRDELFDRSMLSVQGVDVQLAPADMGNAERRASIVKMLKYMGYTGGNVQFSESDLVTPNEVLLTLSFAAVVPPDCPDWRLSPSHNYSNVAGANFGCATEVNLGQMVADPRDLERGTGELPPALSERGDRILREYRTGGEAAQGAAPVNNALGGGDSGGSDTTNAQPTAVPQ